MQFMELNVSVLNIQKGMIESRRMRWAGHVAHQGDTRNVYKILVGKT
jgi:hypothetical protein